MSEQIAQVRRYLADIPELLVEASHYFTPGSAPIDPLANRGTTVFRIPIVPEIFDLLETSDKGLDDVVLSRRYAGFDNAEAEDFNINNGQRRLGVLPTLSLWVALAYAEFEDQGQRPRVCCPARHHTVAGETDWLGQYAGDILELHPEFYRDIEQLWADLRKACRIRKPYVPRCPDHGGVNRIKGVYAESLDDGGPPAWWQCTGCGRTWVHEAEIRRLALTQPKMTLRQISTVLEIPLRTLQRWKTDGRFSGGPLFELEHVRRAAQAVGKIPA